MDTNRNDFWLIQVLHQVMSVQKPLAYANFTNAIFTKTTQKYLAYAIFGSGDRISPKNRITQIAVVKKLVQNSN